MIFGGRLMIVSHLRTSYPLTLDMAWLAGRIEGQQEAKRTQDQNDFGNQLLTVE